MVIRRDVVRERGRRRIESESRKGKGHSFKVSSLEDRVRVACVTERSPYGYWGPTMIRASERKGHAVRNEELLCSS